MMMRSLRNVVGALFLVTAIFYLQKNVSADAYFANCAYTTNPYCDGQGWFRWEFQCDFYDPDDCHDYPGPWEDFEAEYCGIEDSYTWINGYSCLESHVGSISCAHADDYTCQ
jgi:hypothetical protein